MILLDTNVPICAGDQASPYHSWASELIAEAVAGGEGVCANAVSLAEVCVGDADPVSVSQRIAAWGVELVAVPPAAAADCAAAYGIYRARRKADSGKGAPAVPLPDFFHRRACPSHGLDGGDRRCRAFQDLLPLPSGRESLMLQNRKP